MRLFLRLAWRNVWRHRRRTLIVTLSIGMSMALMMMYDGMIAGFNDAIYANAVKILGGNIQIHASGYNEKLDQMPLLPLEDDQTAVQAARALPQVAAATRRINTGGLASNREGAFPVAITGIEPEQELPVNLAAQHVVSGRYLAADDAEAVFIGKGLADAMGVAPGDRITLVGRAVPNQMRRHTMTVMGVYDVGLRDVEKRTVYIPLGQAQDLYGLSGQATEVVISLKQLGQEAAVMRALAPQLPGYEMTSWETNFPELQQALQTKGGVMNVFSVIILVIAGIGILNLLLMAVYERRREIGLLGALGMKPRQIAILFLLEGFMMGLVGAAFGVALGLVFNGLLGWIGIDYSSFANITQYTALISGRIYSTLGTDKLLQRLLTVVIITTLAAFYPAREAARNEPAQALHSV